jgi:hypothetical protein
MCCNNVNNNRTLELIMYVATGQGSAKMIYMSHMHDTSHMTDNACMCIRTWHARVNIVGSFTQTSVDDGVISTTQHFSN